MALFDLFGALAQVATERSALRGRETAAVDPATGERAFDRDTRPLPLEGVPGGFLTDVIRASQGRLTAVDAARIGLPEAAGLSKQNLEELMDQRALPLKEAKQRQDIESGAALEDQRRGRAERDRGYDEASQDPVFKLAVQSVDREIGDSPIARAKYGNDPDSLHRLYYERFKALKATKAGRKPQPVGDGKEAPAASAPAGKGKRIRVKIGNQTGTIDEKDFDAKTMERLGG